MNQPILMKKTCSLPGDKYLQDFSERLFTELIYEFNHYQQNSKREDMKYKVWDYGEIALVSYLTHALRRMDPDYQRFVFMQEVGLENVDQKAQGRADLIIQDLIGNTAVILEAKRHYSSSDAPMKSWEKESSEKYYNEVMGQCKGYFDAEAPKLKAFNGFYRLVMIFDSVGFSECTSCFDSWVNYKSQLDHEYYYFFSDSGNKYGLAIYGIFQHSETNNVSI